MGPRRAVMSPEIVTEFIKLLGNFQPEWVCMIVVSMILAYRSPQLVKELFTGVSTLWRGQKKR
jgi:hypothetical protein